MVENWTNLPEDTVLSITSCMFGEGWQRLKQCEALRVLQKEMETVYLH